MCRRPPATPISFGAHHLPYRSNLTLQQRRFRRHRNALGCLADLQRKIDLADVINANLHTLADELLKSLLFRHNPVNAFREQGGRVGASAVGVCRPSRIRR